MGLAAWTVVVVVLTGASLAVGARVIPLHDVWAALDTPDVTNSNHVIVQTLRLPRTVLAVVVGVALGLSGALMQGVTRNPLADPGILGVNAGAALSVVCAASFFGVSTFYGSVWFAFAGAALAALAVYAIGALGRTGATPVKLALAGAALTVFMGSATTALLLAEPEIRADIRSWAVGSLAGKDMETVLQMSSFVLVGTLLALVCGSALNALALGDDLARGLGQRVAAARAVGAVAVVLLCGAATAVVGPIGFLGLVVPHVARLLTGADYRWVLPYSMVIAPAFLLLADIIGRIAVPPNELQVGIVTAAVGAPFFVWLVRQKRMVEL
ncbi:iron complex transport system permease protein [Quadrisphaera granulorum]|uniref:Iron complex transport system permease protein n=1 Tax=Quadrisphaera granulorum TaxID=317664 RepID=A0A316AEM9_9ACTN|nr:iron chelate uptake ABC transporter family permease subunit [Quadrisphaera granulorum]PWJ56236.1 iron complex transport system permease protein [Quadrisphaera granulorum]SZE94870.1 iron complex transport system permease protein [Quadrisphaera granulorum]